jgi:hypothetical protein
MEIVALIHSQPGSLGLDCTGHSLCNSFMHCNALYLADSVQIFDVHLKMCLKVFETVMACETLFLHK